MHLSGYGYGDESPDYERIRLSSRYS